MKRILAAALSLALLVSLAACGGKDRFDTGKVEEGVCYQLTGIAPDAVAMRVDGIDVPMDMYFYNLCYAASYMESYMNMYGMDLDWSMELQEGETVLDVTKDSILENTKSFAVIEKLAQENNVILDEAALSELETERAETVESLGGEESYRAELAKLGLSEETYDRMCRSDYLCSALEELAATEGSSLYATDEQLIAYAAEQGYMTADHILLLTRDMSTYQELDDETKAEKKALAEELKAKLDAYTGDDLIGYFTELADEYSEDSGRAGNPEGYTFGSGQMVEEFESAAAALGSDFDIEIVEMHHNRKLDAPSGTALMIADGIREALPYEPEYIYDRTQRRAPRGRSEIGIHSIRGGTIVGEHEVIFSGRGEVIRISHSAQGRELFAQGALAAAEYIKNKQNGLYSMKELLTDSAVGMK